MGPMNPPSRYNSKQLFSGLLGLVLVALASISPSCGTNPKQGAPLINNYGDNEGKTRMIRDLFCEVEIGNLFNETAVLCNNSGRDLTSVRCTLTVENTKMSNTSKSWDVHWDNWKALELKRETFSVFGTHYYNYVKLVGTSDQGKIDVYWTAREVPNWPRNKSAFEPHYQ